jgi:hypothetical protein
MSSATSSWSSSRYTPSVAEYVAVVRGLFEAHEFGVESVETLTGLGAGGPYQRLVATHT